MKFKKGDLVVYDDNERNAPRATRILTTRGEMYVWSAWIELIGS